MSWTTHSLLLALALGACSDDSLPAVDAPTTTVDAPLDGPVDAAATLPAGDVIVDGLAAPFALAVSGDRLYVSDLDDGTIKTCSIASCASTLTTFASEQLVSLDAIRVHDGTVVWATNEAIAKCPETDCTSPTLLHTGSLRVTSFEVSAQGDVYFAERNSQTIQRVSLAGGALQPIATGIDDVRDLWLDANGITFTTYGAVTPSLVHATVQRCPLAGCTSAPTLLSGSHVGIGAVGIAHGANEVIWAEASGIRRCPATGCTGEAETLFAASPSFERLLAIDESLVWSEYPAGLHACRASSCAATHASRDDFSPIHAFAVDATYIYAVAAGGPGDGVVTRMSRTVLPR